MNEEPKYPADCPSKKTEGNEWSYNFEDWDVENIEFNLTIIEKTLSEAIGRETQGYSRASSILTMNAMVLALFGTFIAWGENITDPWVMGFFVAGIFSFVVSSGLSVYILISPSRYLSCARSCENDYCDYKKNYKELLKKVSCERINSCESTLTIQYRNSRILSIGVLISLVGLWAIGAGMMRLLTSLSDISLVISFILGAIIAIIGRYGYIRARL